MIAVKGHKARKCWFFFHALVKIDAIRFILQNEARRPREGREKRGWLGGLRDTGYGTDHAYEGCFHPPRTRGRGSRREGGHTFGTPALYIAEKPDLPGNKNFFLHLSYACLLLPMSTCNPLLISPPSARFSLALRLGEAPPSTFLSTASTLSYLSLSRNNVDSGS